MKRLLKQGKEIREKYSKDYSLCDQVIPEGVFFPENEKDVQEIVRYCNKNNIKLSVWGGGSGVNGGAVPASSQEYVISLEKLNNYSVDTENFLGYSEVGVITKDFQEECEKNGLFFPPDPSSADISTIGGNLACSAGGMRGFKYGTFKDYALKLRVVTGKGEIIEIGRETLKCVTGYDLLHLFIGSEGTLGIIISAVFKLLPLPEHKSTIFVSFENISDLVNFFRKIIRNGIVPSNAEFMDYNTLMVIKEFLPVDISEGSAVLLLELDGYSKEKVLTETELIKEIIKNEFYKIANDKKEIEKMWYGRKKLRTELEKIKPNVFSEDFALKLSEVEGFINRSNKICEENNVTPFNFGHIIDGNIHFSVVYDDEKEKKCVENIIKSLSDYVIQRKGTIAGEHGIGKYKVEMLENELGIETINILKSIKDIFDPNHILNNGKIFK